MLMLIANSPVAAFASVTVTVKFAVPTVSGVPLIVPSAARLMPEGKSPAVTDQVYGATPPVAVSVRDV